jgi:hypothetical protein
VPNPNAHAHATVVTHAYAIVPSGARHGVSGIACRHLRGTRYSLLVGGSISSNIGALVRRCRCCQLETVLTSPHLQQLSAMHRCFELHVQRIHELASGRRYICIPSTTAELWALVRNEVSNGFARGASRLVKVNDRVYNRIQVSASSGWRLLFHIPILQAE